MPSTGSGSASHAKAAVSAALGLGLVAAATESTFQVLNRISGLDDPFNFATAFSASAAAVTLAYAIAWFCLVAPLSRAGEHHGRMVRLMFAVFATFLLFSLKLGGATNRLPGLSDLFQASLFGAVVFLVTRPLARNPQIDRRWASFPVAVAALSCLAWYASYSKEFAFAALGVAVCGALAVWVVMRKSLSTALVALLAVHGVFFVGGAYGVARLTRAANAGLIGGATGPAPAHVLLLTIDTFRADSISALKKGAPATPNLDGLAADSVVFETAYSSASWTLPAITSLSTGLPVGVHRASTVAGAPLDGLPALAEELGDAGYRTGFIGDNPHISERNGLGKGFQQFTAFPRNPLGFGLGQGVLTAIFPVRYQAWTSSPDLATRATQWLDENANRPFFLWLHFYDPHAPYAPPQEYIEQDFSGTAFDREFDPLDSRVVKHEVFTGKDRAAVRNLYRSEVRYVDANVGKVLEKLKALGVYDDLLIVFTSDHGEELWEHDGTGHGHTVYNELLRVPLMVKTPSRSPDRLHYPVSTGAVRSTILSELGVQPEGSDCFVEPSLLQEAEWQDRPILAEGGLYDERQSAVIQGGWKWIRRHSAGREEFYDLATDPGERFPLRPDTEAERLRDTFEAFEARFQAARGCFGMSEDDLSPMTPEQKDRLRSLGYL